MSEFYTQYLHAKMDELQCNKCGQLMGIIILKKPHQELIGPIIWDIAVCKNEECKSYGLMQIDVKTMKEGLGFYSEGKLYSSNSVNNPQHYTEGGIETIDIIKAKSSSEEFSGFLKGNVIKYVTRAGKKENKKEDLQKAQWYLTRLIEEVSE